MESPTYSTVWTVELDGLPDRASYCVGQYWSPLDSPTYSIVWTVELDGLPDRASYCVGRTIVESNGESYLFHSMEGGIGRTAG